MYAYVENEHKETKKSWAAAAKYLPTPIRPPGHKIRRKHQPLGCNTELPQDIPGNCDAWIDNMPNNSTGVATGITINGINVASGLEFSGAKDLELTSNDVKNLAGNESVVNNLIYRTNNGSHDDIKVGDVRIRFKAIKASDKGLLLARFANDRFELFFTKKNTPLFRFFAGVESQSEAVSILDAEHQTTLWIMRLVGFLMMFFGLILIANPAMTLLSVIPVFAKIGRVAYGIVAFITSLILTGLTILIAMIFNDVYLAIGT